MESIYPRELSNVKCVLQLMEMRKKREKEKGYEETPSAMSVNGSNDSNSSDMPTLSNHISNNKPSRGSGGSGGIGSASGGVGEPLVNVPMSTNLPPLLPHSALPGSPLFELETTTMSRDIKGKQSKGKTEKSISDVSVIGCYQCNIDRTDKNYIYYEFENSHMMSAKVPSSPDSPPERPSSDPVFLEISIISRHARIFFAIHQIGCNQKIIRRCHVIIREKKIQCHAAFVICGAIRTMIYKLPARGELDTLCFARDALYIFLHLTFLSAARMCRRMRGCYLKRSISSVARVPLQRALLMILMKKLLYVLAYNQRLAWRNCASDCTTIEYSLTMAYKFEQTIIFHTLMNDSSKKLKISLNIFIGTSYEKTTSLPPPLTTESSPIANNTLTSSPQHHAIKNLYRTLVNPLSQRDVSEYLRPADLPLAIPPISSVVLSKTINKYIDMVYMK
ncbi:unnamed protein product [Trichogramma brassicae]|uniref:Uncharacterized protein n=1 Tax=Trichogramma brassicae TaxID=86971 RepID=A0A6H5HSL7_9HYME|nr:unnamed protein product [Trichogramma brassicae]